MDNYIFMFSYYFGAKTLPVTLLMRRYKKSEKQCQLFIKAGVFFTFSAYEMKNFQWQKFPKVQKVQKVQKVHSALPEII